MNEWLRFVMILGTSSAVLLIYLFIKAWRKAAAGRAARGAVYEKTDPNYPPPMRKK